MAILDAELLVVDQVSSFLSNDFLIRDASGNPVGEVVTEGSTMSRMLLGSRRLSIADTDGSVLMRVVDVRTFGRDRFAIEDSAGNLVAELVKQFSLFRKSLTIRLASGEQLDVQGSLFDYDFQVLSGGGVIAEVSRQWPGLGAGLLGRNRYVVSFTPSAQMPLRAAALGAVVALDLIRAKENAAAASSS